MLLRIKSVARAGRREQINERGWKAFEDARTFRTAIILRAHVGFLLQTSLLETCLRIASARDSGGRACQLVCRVLVGGLSTGGGSVTSVKLSRPAPFEPVSTGWVLFPSRFMAAIRREVSAK